MSERWHDLSALRLDGEPAVIVSARYGVGRDLLASRLQRGWALRRACTESPVRAIRRRPGVTVGRTGPYGPEPTAETLARRVAIGRAAAVRDAHHRWLRRTTGAPVYRVDLPRRPSVETADLLGALALSRGVVGGRVVRVRDGALLAHTAEPRPARDLEGAARRMDS